MDYYQFEEPYYDTSVADGIFLEAKTKLEQALSDDIKAKVEELKDRGERLDKREDEIIARERKYRTREAAMKNKEKELESKFYQSKMSDLKEKIFDSCFEVYTFDSEYIKREKCKFCNDDRKIEVVLPDGAKALIDCSCKKGIRKYHITKLECYSLEFRKGSNEKNINFWGFADNNNERITLNERSKIYSKVSDMSEKAIKEKHNYCVYFSSKEEAEKYLTILNSN